MHSGTNVFKYQNIKNIIICVLIIIEQMQQCVTTQNASWITWIIYRNNYLEEPVSL